MLPIPYFFTRTTWSGTYSTPNYLWYDFGAATASTNTNDKNTIVSGRYSRLWDFTGNGRHSFTTDIRYVNNFKNSLPVGGGSASSSTAAFAQNATSLNTPFTIIVMGQSDSGAAESGLRGTIASPVSNGAVEMSNEFDRVAGFNPNNIVFPTGMAIINYTGDKQSFLFGCKFTGTTMSAFYDGQTVTNTIPGTTQSSSEVYITIGANANTYAFEFMVWNYELSDSQITDVFGYLSNKWLGE